jgi:L-seryl-tRNA(Ser) seleniumtransferase
LQELLRKLPAVDEVLRSLADVHHVAHWAKVEAIRAEIDALRKRLLAKQTDVVELDMTRVIGRAEQLAKPTLRKVINASGVVVHTNLGRAPLSERALERMVQVARGYSTLEYDVQAGGRGSRHVHVARLLRELTGAADGAVVNNNAGATLLALTALAAGRDVIVSRGELVEIGGSFRMPEVMSMAGARLKEVGTTNRTHPRDYADAIDENTGLLLKVHASNFAVVGFTREVEPHEMVEIGQKAGVPTMFDLGSGTLIDFGKVGLGGKETTVQQAVEAGFDLVTFSGDKLLGGPQAGLIVGKEAAVERARRHPLMRALRPDKLCFAALEATLEAYREGVALDEIPVAGMLSVSQAALEKRANMLRDKLKRALQPPFSVAVVETDSRAGGGTYPITPIHSWAVQITHPQKSATQLERILRAGEPPLIARIERDRLLLDLRTLDPKEEALVVELVASLATT